jgi:hypothetical protein
MRPSARLIPIKSGCPSVAHHSKRQASYRPKPTPTVQTHSAPQPYWRRRPASTHSSRAAAERLLKPKEPRYLDGGKALLFAGLVSWSHAVVDGIDNKGSYPHTPHSPTPSSLRVWEIASEALLSPDATIGYWPKGMEEFAAKVGRAGLRGWMRDWVEGRSLVSLYDSFFGP